MKTIISFLLILFTIIPAAAQVKKDGIFRVNDSTIEFKTWKKEKITREFIRTEGAEALYFREFFLHSGKLKTQGILKSGYCIGTWSFYKKNGKLSKTVSYKADTLIPYKSATAIYNDLFLKIKKQNEALLSSTIKKENSNYAYYIDDLKSYYFRNSFPEHHTHNIHPNLFLLRYNLIFSDGQLYRTFPYAEIETDSLGLAQKIKYTCTVSNALEQPLISTTAMDSIAFINGFTETDVPFNYDLIFVKGDTTGIPPKLELRICAKPSDIKQERDGIWYLTTFYFNYIDIDPWTGKVIRKGNTATTKRTLP